MQLKTERLADKAANTNLGYQTLPDLAVRAQNKAPLDNLRRFLESFTGPVIFSVESEGRREALSEMLARIKVAPKHVLRLEEATGNGRYLMIGAAEHGFIDSQRGTALICESDLLGERVARRRQDSRRTINPDTLIRNLAELHIGQPVVHGTRRGPLRGHDYHGSRRHHRRISDADLRQRCQAIRSGIVPASYQPLRRRGGRKRPCTSWAAMHGPGRDKSG